MAARSSIHDRIVDAALERAETVGWGALRLHDVAADLDIPLAEIRIHFRDLDAVADAWFARADRAMLRRRDEAGFIDLPVKERLFIVITRWLDALSGHRAITGQILAAKCYPGHPQHVIPLIFTLSRTVQWIREAAELDAPGLRRAVEEWGLTALFAATVIRWLRDDSDHQERTRRFLGNRLDLGDRIMARVWPPRRPAGEADEAATTPATR